MEQITHVAVKFEGIVHSLPKPNRHHNVMRMIAEKNGTGVNGPDVQGFVTNGGRFLNRREAYILALENGQLNRSTDAQAYQGSSLYSEDLW